jgi:hypothetical protein
MPLGLTLLIAPFCHFEFTNVKVETDTPPISHSHRNGLALPCVPLQLERVYFSNTKITELGAMSLFANCHKLTVMQLDSCRSMSRNVRYDINLQMEKRVSSMRAEGLTSTPGPTNNHQAGSKNRKRKTPPLSSPSSPMGM